MRAFQTNGCQVGNVEHLGEFLVATQANIYIMGHTSILQCCPPPLYVREPQITAQKTLISMSTSAPLWGIEAVEQLRFLRFSGYRQVSAEKPAQAPPR